MLINPASRLEASSVAMTSLPSIASSQIPSDCNTARTRTGSGRSRRDIANPTTSKVMAHCNAGGSALSQIEIRASTSASINMPNAIREGSGSSVREGADRIDQGSQFGIGTEGVGEKPALQIAIFAFEQAFEAGQLACIGYASAMTDKPQ